MGKSKIIGYIATCEEESISLFGRAGTPVGAFAEFMSNGHFEEYCAIHDIMKDEKVEVTVWSIVNPEDYEDPEWAIDEGFEWVTCAVQFQRNVESKWEGSDA